MGTYFAMMLIPAAVTTLMLWATVSIVAQMPSPKLGLSKKQKAKRAKKSRRAARRRVRIAFKTA